MNERIFDYFIPPSLREPLDDNYRARILVVVSFLGASVLILFLIARFALQGLHPYPFILLATILVILLSPWIMRSSESIFRGGMFMTLFGSVGFYVMCIFDGGINSPSVFALPLMTLLAIFFGSLRVGLIMTGLAALLYFSLAALTEKGWILPGPLSPQIYFYVSAASALSTTLVLLAMAYMFIEWQRTARERLTLANQAKDEFLSGMSHELRTPLNSVMGFTEVLMHEYVGPLNEDQKKQLGFVYQSSEHLLELVEDLVNLTNIEAGKMSLDCSSVNLQALVKFCTDAMAEKASRKYVDFQVDHADAPDAVVADETRLRQILLNLLSNAVKFSPGGETVRIKLRGGDGVVQIEVSDSGPGVDEADQERIFDKFFQVESSLAGKTVGSGLGLYISRQLAEMHGGRLLLTKSDSTGSTFTLELPLEAVA